MKKKALTILFLFIFSFALSQGQLTAESICQKHVEKLGGHSLLNALKNICLEQRLLINNQEYQQKVSIVNNQALRLETNMLNGIMIVAVKDSSGWQVNPFAGSTSPQKLKPEELQRYRVQTDIIGALYKYKEKNIKVVLLGNERVLSKDAYKLELTYPNGFKTTVFVDISTFFLLKIKDIYQETLFSDYRKVEGYYFPFATIIKSKMGNLIVNVNKILVNQVIDNKIFDRP